MKTVKMLLPLTVALLLSISPAAGISCHRCFGQICPSPASLKLDCPLKSMCLAGTIRVTGQGDIQWQDCADATTCPTTGYNTFSMTADVMTSAIISMTTSKVFGLAQIKCCNSDYCNTPDLIPPVPLAPSAGTVMCPMCDPKKENCKPIPCNAKEDNCFKAKGAVGCASANTCASKQMHEMFFFLSRLPSDLDMVCHEPVLQCELCLNPCGCAKPTTVSAPPGMKCVAARVKDTNSSSERVVKALAGAPLCSVHLDLQSFSLKYEASEPPKHIIQVTCCEEDFCNSDVPMEVEGLEPSLCVRSHFHDDLFNQLHLLVSGAGAAPGSTVCTLGLDEPNERVSVR